MQIVERALSEIRPYEKNPRKNRDAVKAVADSINEYGFRQPIVVDEDGVIIVGHTRLIAAQRLGLDSVPVHVAEGLTPDQARAYRLMDNRSHENASWDEDLLKFEFEGLLDSGFDLDLTGFSGPEINALLDPEPANEADNDVIQPPENPVAAPGDIWQCGPHRIVCGDATDKAAVDALGFDGHLMVTDPPYGVEYDASWRTKHGWGGNAEGRVTNDDTASWHSAFDLFSGGVGYVWVASMQWPTVAGDLAALKFDVRAQIIWRKQNAVMSRGHYHWQHEMCLYAVRRGAKAHWCGDRKQSTIWDIANANPMGGDDEDGRTGHSTQKPVECMARPIRNHTKPGGKVYDPFLGSGTTLVAAHQLGRVGYGIEISPAYVDVICQRLEKHVGEPARKVAEV